MAKNRDTGNYDEDKLFQIVRRVESYLVTHIKAIIILSIICVIGVGIYFTIDYFLTKKEDNANNTFGMVYIKYQTMINDKNLKDKERNKKLEGVVKDFQKVREVFPGTRAASRSEFFAGNILYKFDKIEKAAKEFEKGYENKNNSYIASLCLLNEATCYEQLKNIDKAEEIYKTIITNYKKSYLIPTVKFLLGQLYEIKGNDKMAEMEYNKIINNYNWSNWKDFSEKRLLLVKVLH